MPLQCYKLLIWVPITKLQPKAMPNPLLQYGTRIKISTTEVNSDTVGWMKDNGFFNFYDVIITQIC